MMSGGPHRALAQTRIHRIHRVINLSEIINGIKVKSQRGLGTKTITNKVIGVTQTPATIWAIKIIWVINSQLCQANSGRDIKNGVEIPLQSLRVENRSGL